MEFLLSEADEGVESKNILRTHLCKKTSIRKMYGEKRHISVTHVAGGCIIMPLLPWKCIDSSMCFFPAMHFCYR